MSRYVTRFLNFNIKKCILTKMQIHFLRIIDIIKVVYNYYIIFYLQRFDIHVERAHGNDVNRLQGVINFRRGAQNGRPPNV
jgi:hypothetical protein